MSSIEHPILPKGLRPPPASAVPLSRHRLTPTDGPADGLLWAVRVPTTAELPPPDRWPVHPDEVEQGRGYGVRRQITWVAGRLAIRAALGELLGVEPATLGPVGTDDRRAPRWPAGVSGSLTHTDRWAIAWVARGDGLTRGIDLEDPRRGGMHLADMLLLEPEKAATVALPESAQTSDLIRRFALKEAIYKAIDPRYRRYVDFKEVAVWPDAAGDMGGARVEWSLAQGERPPAEMGLSWQRWGDAGWLCGARARWAE